MDPPRVTLEPAAEDLPYVRGLLVANDLPSADVDAAADALYLAVDGDERVGIGGLERHGDAGLLRSVVVEAATRGQGYGTAICDALERRGRESGLDAIYLLTTTASQFFAARGYEAIDRTAAPESIRATPEFEDLCPADATCMRRRL